MQYRLSFLQTRDRTTAFQGCVCLFTRTNETQKFLLEAAFIFTALVLMAFSLKNSGNTRRCVQEVREMTGKERGGGGVFALAGPSPGTVPSLRGLAQALGRGRGSLLQ